MVSEDRGIAGGLATELVDVLYVFRLEPDPGFEFVSPSVTDLVGYTPEEHYADPDLGNRLVDPRDEMVLQAALAAPLGEVVDVTVRWIAKDGRVVWTHHRCRKAARDDAAVVLYGAARDITAEREAIQNLAEARRRYRMLAENASDVVTSSDNDGVITWASDSVESVLGWSSEEMVGRTFRSLVHPDDWAEATGVQDRLLRGEACLLEVRVMTRAGDHRWMSISVRPMVDDRGEMIGGVAGWRDVHEQHLARESLTRSEARFRAALEDAPIGISLVAPDGSFVEVNEALCELLGRSAEKLKASTWQELTHPEDLDADLDLVQEVLDGRREKYRITKRYLRPDGRVVWGDLSVSCVRDEQGRVEQFIAQIVDVSQAVYDRLRREATIGEYERRLDVGTDVIIELDDAFVVAWVSPNAQELFAVSPRRLLGLSVRDVVPAQSSATVERTLKRLGERGGTERLEFWVDRPDGTRVWVDAVAERVDGMQSRTLGFVVRVRDITEYVAKQQELLERVVTDPLTGLLTRGEMDRRLDVVLSHPLRSGSRLFLAFIDVDGLKTVNDTFGHEAGDELLRVVAQRARDRLRSGDVLGRFGGDEFIALLPGVRAPEDARTLLGDLVDAVGQPHEYGDLVLVPRISVGAAEIHSGDDADDVLRRADRAMYEAKLAGGNRVQLTSC